MPRDKDPFRLLVRALVDIPEHQVGLFRDLAAKLLGPDGGDWEEETKVFLSKQRCWLDGPDREPAPPALEFVAKFCVPAVPGKFVAKDRFAISTDKDGCVARSNEDDVVLRVSAISGDFAAAFLVGGGLIEDPIPKQNLLCNKLRRTSSDIRIIAELGGEGKSETFLCQFFFLLKKQRNGEDGALLTNGDKNIFYIRDKEKILRMVWATWDNVRTSWYLNAYPAHAIAGRPTHKRSPDSLVFSPELIAVPAEPPSLAA